MQSLCLEMLISCPSNDSDYLVSDLQDRQVLLWTHCWGHQRPAEVIVWSSTQHSADWSTGSSMGRRRCLTSSPGSCPWWTGAATGTAAAQSSMRSESVNTSPVSSHDYTMAGGWWRRPTACTGSATRRRTTCGWGWGTTTTRTPGTPRWSTSTSL